VLRVIKQEKVEASARNTITAGSKNIDQLKIYFPDLNIKEGDKFEVRYKRGKDGKQIPIFIPMQ
jgi:hypothetical protein